MNLWAKQIGFTIVELLIVIVVIGILAAISVVAYNGVQNKAADSVIRTDLANIAKKLELTKAESGHYPETLLEMPDYKLSKKSYDLAANNAYYCVDRENQAYAFGARSRSKRGFILTSNGLRTNVPVAAVLTCDSIGKTWTNDSTTWTVQGYSTTGYSDNDGWAPGWRWTQ